MYKQLQDNAIQVEGGWDGSYKVAYASPSHLTHSLRTHARSHTHTFAQ